MLNNRTFWLAMMAGCSLMYLAALTLMVQGQLTHWLVILCAIILFLHVLEIPMALGVLKKLNPQPARVVIMVLIFGLLWHVPARRGLFPVR